MKRFILLLGLCALAAIPAAAAENPSPTNALDLVISSPACSTVATSSVPAVQSGELPSWLTSNPLMWAEAQRTGCAAYCRDTCEGCCAFPAPGICACC